MEEQRKCSNCRNFLPMPEGHLPGHGFCRANPPTILILKDPNTGEDKLNTQFPIMNEAGWCGQFTIGKGPGYHVEEQKQVLSTAAQPAAIQ